MEKLITEFYRLNINGKIKTVAIRRNEYDFENIDMESEKSVKLWKKLINEIMMDMFNLDVWEYLGDDKHYNPKRNELIMFIEYKKIEK